MRSLRLSYWNINGIFRNGESKHENEEFVNSVQHYDIFGLVETHTGPDDTISIPNCHTYQANRPKSINARKFSGGIAVLVKNDIKEGVKLCKTDTYSIWLKLEKSYFGVNNDIYVCITYLPPANSTYSRRADVNCINVLEEQIQHFSLMGNIILLGDFNGRTANKGAFVPP